MLNLNNCRLVEHIRASLVSVFSPSKSTSFRLSIHKNGDFSTFSSLRSTLKEKIDPFSMSCRASVQLDGTITSEEDKTTHGVSYTFVGVLGGGQLGRMLCQAASQMAIKVVILDPLEDCPGRSMADRSTHSDRKMQVLVFLGV